MRPRPLAFLGIFAASALSLVHCGAWMDVDDAPATALASATSPQAAATSTDTHIVATASPGPHFEGWPLETDVAPIVLNMPPSAEVSIESVARYLRDHEKNPMMLVKALHDWVADRIAYAFHDPRPTTTETPSWDKGHALPIGTLTPPHVDGFGLPDPLAFMLSSAPLGPPSPFAAFHSRKGVCADYASLLTELGKNAGIDIGYLTGWARVIGDNGVEDGYHAWNVARVGGKSYLIDPTWDAGRGEGAAFERRYSTDYLFTPPEVFAVTHFPDDGSELHTGRDMTRAEFDAQPMTTPRFSALGMKLAGKPTVGAGHAHFSIDDPLEADLSVYAMPETKAPFLPALTTPVACAANEGTRVVVDCPLATQGPYGLLVVARSGTKREHVALLEVQSGRD